jgi:hypothetical protein
VVGGGAERLTCVVKGGLSNVSQSRSVGDLCKRGQW